MLDNAVREMAQEPNYAAFTTMLPDGQPMTHIMWVDADDDHVLINTEVHRAKFRNVQRNPKVTLAIWDAENLYRYAEVRGQVVETVTGPEARKHIDALSRKYTGHDYDSPIASERVLLRIAPKRQRVANA